MFYQPNFSSNAANIAAAVGQGLVGGPSQVARFGGSQLPYSRSRDYADMMGQAMGPWTVSSGVYGSAINNDAAGMYSLASNAISAEASTRASEDRVDAEERIAKMQADALKYGYDKQYKASKPQKNPLAGGIGIVSGLAGIAKGFGLF